jgi:hypothetical protein
LVAALVLSLCRVSWAAAPLPGSGDLDGNGKVDIRDAVWALRLVVGLPASGVANVLAGDLNGDGRVSIADAVNLVRIAAGLLPPPTLGTDPVGPPHVFTPVRVSLPPGMAATGLSVLTTLGAGAVAPDGSAIVLTHGGESELGFVRGPAGQPVLMGWLGEGSAQISARSTAEALVFAASGSFLLPWESRLKAMELLRGAPELDALAQALSASLAVNANSLAEPTPAVFDALIGALAVLGFGPRQAFARSRLRGVRYDPLEEQSGISLDLPGVQDVALRNRYRRAAYAWVERDSYQGSDHLWHESPAKIAEIEVPATVRLSSVIGTFLDIVKGKYAYADQVTEPVSIPLYPPDALLTRYKVSVVGFGDTVGDFGMLTAEQRDKQSEVALLWYTQDVFLPVLMNNLIPSLKLDTEQRFLTSNDVLKDYVKVMTSSIPSIKTKVDKGDMSGAFAEAWTGLSSSMAFRKATLNLVMDSIELASPRGAEAGADALSIAKQVLNAISIADKLLQAYDWLSILSIWLQDGADMGNQWTVDVTRAKVTLTPADVKLPAYQTALLTAAVAEAGGSAASIEYRWSATGTGGTLTDGIHSGTSFTSSKEWAQYIAEKGVAAEDEVIVEAFLVTGQDRTSLGLAKSRIHVSEAVADLSPAVSNLMPGDTVALTATLKIPNPGGTLAYRWTNPGAAGHLLDAKGAAADSQETTTPTLTYKASTGGASDLVTGEILSVGGDVWTSLGTATALVKVSDGTQAAERRVYFSDTWSGGELKKIVMGVAFVWKALPGKKVGGWTLTLHTDGAMHYPTADDPFRIFWSNWQNGKVIEVKGTTESMNARLGLGPEYVSYGLEGGTLTRASPDPSETDDKTVARWRSYNQTQDAWTAGWTAEVKPKG